MSVYIIFIFSIFAVVDYINAIMLRKIWELLFHSLVSSMVGTFKRRSFYFVSGELVVFALALYVNFQL